MTARDLVGVARAENTRRAAADARDRVMVYEDLGSGSLLPPILNAPDAEPTVGQSLSGGCDLVSFSGDKLLGGPQAGIIVGKKAYIDRLKKNPLARAMRLDKMTLAALEATLRLYLDGTAYERIPTLRMLNATLGEMREAADALAAAIEKRLPSGCASVSVVEEFEKAGGGSLPTLDIPGAAVRIDYLRGNANDCERAMATARAHRYWRAPNTKAPCSTCDVCCPATNKSSPTRLRNISKHWIRPLFQRPSPRQARGVFNLRIGSGKGHPCSNSPELAQTPHRGVRLVRNCAGVPSRHQCRALHN